MPVIVTIALVLLVIAVVVGAFALLRSRQRSGSVIAASVDHSTSSVDGGSS